MNRKTFLLSLSGLAGCFSGRRPRLNVYNWSEYVAPDTIPNFEREFGVRVRYSVFESNEEMLAKVMTGNSGWDVVFPSNYIIDALVRNNLAAPLDHKLLPNLGNLDARLQKPQWDPDLRWSVPYMTGASGILYQGSADHPPKSWADLWDQRWKGRITMLDDPVEVLGACLKKSGFSINSVSPAELELARREAIAQKALLRAYLNAEVRDQVVAGDVLAAQLWATTAAQAIDAASHLKFCYPSEGFALYADNCVILRESRRRELAHQFFNYLLRPEVAAKVVLESKTATPNAAAWRRLPEEVRGNSTLYPGPEILERGEWFAALPSAGQKLRDRIWTEIKSA